MLAEQAVEAALRTGAAILAAEPWRIGRIIRGADDLTLQELAGEVVRRRRLPPPADFNRVVALAQLARALEFPGFAARWRDHARSNRLQPLDYGDTQ
jgi:hypothetical protein